MSQYTLTVVDTTGIQNYIFGTNNLQQNVGASYLVDCATRKWVVEALPFPHNVRDLDDPAQPFTGQKIETNNLAAEVIYAGGGNTAIIFASRDEAVAFAHRLTRRVLVEAPGLNIVLAHEDFDWQRDALGGERGCIKRAMDALADRKQDYPASSPILGLGVTAACAFTGLPAIDRDQDERLISAEVKAKMVAADAAHQRLKNLADWGGYEIPKDFDDFGRTKGESSYIAVIHTDGNGMGKRIQQIRNQFPTAEQNRDYVEEMRAFSLSVQRAADKALQSTVTRLVQAVRREKDGDYIGKNKEIKIRGNKLPLRPIVFGGDDVTFVCDGRLGLSLTAYYLEQFSQQRLADGELAHCRAGIAVVKTHYPFARAYTLADDLCRSAKAYIKERQQTSFNEGGLTAMDWHFAVGGLTRDLTEVRNREYTVPAGELFMRPIRLTDPDKDWRSWDTFCNLTKSFQSDKQWADRRNKVKTLRDALHAGPEAVEHFRRVYLAGEPLPSIPGQPDMARQGWQGGRCGYFDAIEAVDFFVEL